MTRTRLSLALSSIALVTLAVGCSSAPTDPESTSTASEPITLACTAAQLQTAFDAKQTTCSIEPNGRPLCLTECRLVTAQPPLPAGSWPGITATTIPPPSGTAGCTLGLSIPGLSVSFGCSGTFTYTANIWACPASFTAPTAGLGAAPLCNGSSSYPCETVLTGFSPDSNPFVGAVLDPTTWTLVQESVFTSGPGSSPDCGIGGSCKGGCILIP